MKGPAVLITGCSGSGIGYHLACAFSSAGCRVYASARNMERLQASNLPEGVELVQMDVCSSSSVDEAVGNVVKHSGGIEILVNNAGQGCVGALAEVELDRVRDTFEINVFGLIRVSQAVSKNMIKQGKGTIVNISSIVSFVPTPWAGIYCASKASVTSLSDVLRMELAGFGIRVMCVFPGAIKSNIGAANAANAVQDSKQSGPYANVRHHIDARGSWSQCDASTPAADLANEIAQNALKSAPPAYLSAGYRSKRAWLSFYLPYWLKDYLWGAQFGTGEVGKAHM
ncbi:hypothetical protein CBS101457_005012 [Exobasidium rhododendri]|nr:hypothetical protein CBS101457_005012 [Exobasidium rhododendri]